MSSSLETAVAVAREAGAVLRDEFNRPDGPRGTTHHAEVDEQAQALILQRLNNTFPDDGSYLAEEGAAFLAPTGSSRRLWIVDPNDGTSAFMDGLSGHPNESSQANGALMRVSPFGISDLRPHMESFLHPGALLLYRHA